MVSEFVRGVGFDALKEADQETRDRVGEIVFRFYFGCMYRHRQFSGDPHPGNFLLLGDDRVAFLDFGLFKVMPPTCSSSSWSASAPATRATRSGSTTSSSRAGCSSTRTASARTRCSRSSSTPPGGT